MFSGVGGAVSIPDDAPRMREHFFHRDFEPPLEDYARNVELKVGPGCGAGRCFFFRDRTGSVGDEQHKLTALRNFLGSRDASELQVVARKFGVQAQMLQLVIQERAQIVGHFVG